MITEKAKVIITKSGTRYEAGDSQWWQQSKRGTVWSLRNDNGDIFMSIPIELIAKTE